MTTNGTIAGDVGIYLRLSREEGDKLESDSIRNQRELIMGFIARNKRMRIVKEYVDDGYSGTNFNRPSFIRMVNDARTKKINCIVVKDLSRLGRDYIETGRYIEKIFPSLGVRLIAVNDNYDSNDKSTDESIIIPFKNLINDAYCRDISMKIRSHLDVKRKNGQYIGSFALYGYLKDPENKNHLVVDEYAAEIVEMIFNLYLSGYGTAKIADKLNEMGVQMPYEYKRKMGLNYDSGFRTSNDAKWGPTSVSRILKNEMYTGKMIQGKLRKINYKVSKNVYVDKESWICVDGTHDAIIPREKFDKVQKLLSCDIRTAPFHDKVLPLCGYIKCGACHQNMIRKTDKYKDKRYYSYRCSTYKNGGNCTSHHISCNKVEQAVVEAIRKQIELLDKIERILEIVDEQAGERIAVQNVDRQLEKLAQEIEYHGSMKAKLYKDLVDGVLEKADYLDLNERFEKSRKDAESKYNKLLNKREQIMSGELYLQPWVENLKKYRNITELSRSAVVALLDRVIVHNSDDIEVVFLFEDEMKNFTECLEVNEMEAGE